MVGPICKPVIKYWRGRFAEVDRLHVKRNKIMGMNYLGIIDKTRENFGEREREYVGQDKN